jgi:hypothetical protein
MVHGAIAVFRDDRERVVCADVDCGCLRRVLVIECMSEDTLPLFLNVV